MTTKEFLLSIDFEKGLKDLESATGETMDFEDYKRIDSQTKLGNLIKKYCSLTFRKDMYGKNISFYTINNEEVLNYFRDMWLESKNDFVKKVIVSVGKEKKFTEKQIDVIMKEAVKFDIELRFKN